MLALFLTLPFGLNAASAATTGVTFTVTSSADAVDANLGNGVCATASGACTLRAAIQQANAVAGADVVQVPAGTYALALRPQNQNLADTGDLDVTGPLTVVGDGPQATIVDGGAPASSAPEIRGLDRLFEVHAGAGDVSLAGLTIREGYSAEQGGAIHNSTAGLLRLEDVAVLDSYAAKYGGGIANAGAGRIELVRSTVSGNGAKEGGSAIHNAIGGTISITEASAIVENPGASLAQYPATGGAINNEGEGDTIGTIEVLDSTIARNEATSNGAGIYNERDGRVVVLRSTITGNRTSASGAGIYSNSGTVLIREGTTISDNHAGSAISSGSGGGIYNAGQMSKAGTPGRLEIANATITRNTATADGAGVHCGLDAALVVTDSEISNNAAAGEGGGVSAQAKADLSVARTTFAGNSADVAGGGAYVYAEGVASFQDAVFTDNRAGETGGGGLLTDGSGVVSIEESTFLRNRSVGDGGGLLVSSGGGQTISDSLVADNHTDEGGGGIFNSGMVVTFERLTITSNTAVLDGGGIKSEGSGQFTIVDSTVSGNSAENGGGFTNAADGAMSILRSTLRDNEARIDGGGYLEIGDANSMIENSTLSGNRAGNRGGGLYTNADAELRVVNVTITDNTAAGGSGLSTSVESLNFPVVPATRVILQNTIVADNHDGINCHGAVFSEGGNLDDGTTCFFSDPSDLTRGRASVEPLAANGGPTQTHALKPSSIAVDRGVDPCPALDQRGVDRPQNEACDIGAYEFEGVPEAPDVDPLPPPTGPDSEPPKTTLDTKPPVRTVDTSASFAFRADELAMFECVLDPATGASYSGCESPHDYTNLALGLHTFQVRATDAAHNVGEAITYQWRIVVELVPPETTIDSGPTGLTKATAGSFEFSANEPASFECSLDGAAFDICASPVAVSGLVDGSHTFEVRATDSSFNPDESPASRTWTVDTTPPETAVDTGPSGLTNDATPTFAFSSEPGATFACRVDAAPFAACGAPLTTAALADGAHTFDVQASDAAGNVDSTPASRAFTVDTIAPETAVDAGPSGLTNDSTPTFSLSAGEPSSSFECRVDAEAFAPCTSSHTTASLGEGAHTFEARATDSAGNTDDTPALRSFTVDTIAPDTTIVSGPSGLTRATDASFAFDSEASASFACRLDGGNLATCTSPQAYEALGDGAHAFEVRATDAAGNVDDTPASRVWTVDTTPPDTTIESGPSAIGNDATPSFAFSSEQGAGFECGLGAGLAPCVSPYDVVEPLADGAYVFEVRATDAAGNTGAVASLAFEVDTQAPEVTIDSGPSALTNDATPSFVFSSEEGATFVCSLDGTSAACESPSEVTTALADGAHAFEVRATDLAGNAGNAASRSFTVDTQGPAVTLIGPSALTNDPTPVFTFTSEDGATFDCAQGAVFTACDSPYEVVDPLADGSYTFEVRATDAAGNAGEVASLAYTIDTVGPGVTVDSGPNGLTNDSTPTFAFSSEEGATFACALDSAFAPCESPYEVTVPLTDGAHAFEVKAADAAGNEGASVRRELTVDTQGPVVTLTGPSGLTNDSTPTFLFGSEEGATFTCSLDGAISACESPYEVATALADGAHTFQLQAVDAAGNRGPLAGLAFTVDTQGPAVTLAGPSGAITETTPAFTFASEAGASFECALGAGFAACESPYQVVEPLADGAYTFDVRATDAAGNTGATASLAFTVDTQGPATTIDSGPDGVTNDATPAFSFGSEDGSSFACALDSAFAPCESPYEVTAPLADGAHLFRVRATDAAGNEGDVASREFTVDTNGPATSLTGPSGLTDDATPTFTFTSEAGATFACSLDGPFAACGSPYEVTTPLADGTHTFSVVAADGAGNTGAAASREFTVDTTAPAISLTGPEPETSETTARLTFSADEAVTGFRCALDTAAPATCGSPVDLSGLGLGQHTFRVEATDAAGNSGTKTHTWKVVRPPDTTAPTITISGPPEETSDTMAHFVFGADEAVTGYTCRLDAGSIEACASPVDLSGLALGGHSFEVGATDVSGNVGTSSHSWTVVAGPDVTPPVLTLSGPETGTQETDATLTFSANEPVTFACALDSGDYGPCTSDSSASYSDLAPGAHEFRLQATDAADNSATATWSWTILEPPAPEDTTPPVLTLSGPASSTQSTTASFTFSANEPATFACSLDSADFSACPTDSGASYSGLQPGPHQFRVTATDAADNSATATWNWTITAPPPPPACSGTVAAILPAQADSWILETSPTSNYGADSALKLDTKSGANARVLIRFALPSVPAGCTLKSAQLRLYAGSYKAGRTLEAVPLAAAWSERVVTWQNQPAVTGVAATASSGSGYRSWNVLSQLQAMLQAGDGNGFLIRDASENGPGLEQAFNSREKGSDNPPQLIVTIG